MILSFLKPGITEIDSSENNKTEYFVRRMN